MTVETPDCPHCKKPMEKWAIPPLAPFNGEFQYVCFNDECPYFTRGWTWMQERFGVVASYRHRVDPETGASGPLPVWSKDALKNSIIRAGGAQNGR